MLHASLFSGIGGFDLAAEWAGWSNAFTCEIDGFCRKILKYHFPKSVHYEDIRTTNFTEWRGCIDVLSGGFPCQPFSAAGKRKGTMDDRYLWPEMLRVIRQIAPKWVVGENVGGLVTWQGGLVLETVCSDLENAGYEVQPFIIPACAVGAPHRRDRVWIIAHSDSIGCRKRPNKQEPVERSEGTTDTCDVGQTASASSTYYKRIGKDNLSGPDCWEKFPTQPPVCSGDDGLPDRLDAITFPAWRRQSVKAYGNAIVPHVALAIFQTINSCEMTFGFEKFMKLGGIIH